ncbi:hypothetical protein D3C80_2123910 [compost metagenome]
MLHMVTGTELFESHARQHQLDVELGIANGEIELDKGISSSAAHTDVARHIVESGR